MKCLCISDMRLHPEVFVNMDNYVYPSDEETIEVEDSEDSEEESETDTEQKPEGKEDLKPKKTKQIKVRRKADENTIRKLEVAYRRLTWSRNQSRLLKKFLTKPIFEVLKFRVTKESNANLLDVIKAGIEHLDSDAGILAPDAEAYLTFKPLLHPVICTLHDANPDQVQPQEDWNINEDVSLDPKCMFVESVAMRISRSIKGFPFQAKMTKEQYVKMETDLRNAFKKITSAPIAPEHAVATGVVKEVPGLSSVVGGTYYPLDKIPKTLERQLDKDGLLFDQNDPLLKSANMYNHWPTGRGIFLIGTGAQTIANNKTKKKDVAFIWINEADHLKIVVGRKDADLAAAFRHIHQVAAQIQKFVSVSLDSQFGYLTSSPGLVGTGLKASVRMHLPFLGSEPIFREEICNQHNLICEKIPHEKIDDFYEVSNKRKFGITEAHVIRELYRGIQEVIDLESRYKQP